LKWKNNYFKIKLMPITPEIIEIDSEEYFNFLDQRLKEYEDNPELGENLKDVLEQLKAKYGF